MFSSSKKTRAHGQNTHNPKPVHGQPTTLEMLQYQDALIRDFWSGSAAGLLPPPPAHCLSVLPLDPRRKSSSSDFTLLSEEPFTSGETLECSSTLSGETVARATGPEHEH